MGNILLIGGMGSGKTTLAEALRREVPEAYYLYMSLYAVQIPLTIIKTITPDLLSLPKDSYTSVLRKCGAIEPHKFTRAQMDESASQADTAYGRSFFGELAFALAPQDKPTIIDNIVGELNVRFLRDKKFYVVGLECSVENQVERRLKDHKEMDPTDRALLEWQVRETNNYFQIEKCLQLATHRYDTNNERSDSEHIVREVAGLLRA